MKKVLTILILLCVLVYANANENITFADANVKAICVANWDTNNDGELSEAEAAAVTNLGSVFVNNKVITSFDELQYFSGLTSIGSSAFLSCSALTSISIPNSVTNIGMEAFSGCSALISVNIPNSVTSIGFEAFDGCSSLTSVSIPNSVTSIGGYAFYGCSHLASVTVDLTSPLTINQNCFSNRANATLNVPYGSSAVYEAATYWNEFKEIVEMPEPVVNITFADSKVKELCVANWDTDGDGELSEAEAAAVTDLGEVFKGNTDITSFDELAYFTGLTTISADAFCKCTSLTSVKLPSTVTSIGSAAFLDCGQLSSIDFNGCKASIKHEAFKYCTSLVSVTLPSGTYMDGYSCFIGCTSLKSFVMEPSDNLQDNWFEGAFGWCTNLETAVVYGKVLRGPNNFRKCTSLQTVTYLDSTPGTNYNQNFRGAASGIQFIIPESSAETFLRQGYVNLSDKSALPIAREEFEDEVARIEAMATAAGSDATALSQAISEARTIVNNATDYPTVFAQIAVVKEAARDYLATATLTDELDVTAAYVTNPDITRFDIGWQTPSGWMASGYQTANYTNGDVSIDHFVEMYKGDGALPDGKINQTISQLPAGKYRLEADVIAANALSNAEVTGVSLYMGEENTAVATEDKKPQHFSVEFINSTTRDVEIGINIVSTTANRVAADNFQLYYLESLNGVITDLITDATEENPANLTALIQNPSFSNDNGEGWLGDEAEFNEENSHPNNARFVHSDSFDFYQNLSGLPNGRYVLKVKGFHRPGTHDNAYADYIQGNNNASAVVYANSCSKVLPHIATGAQDALPDGCKSIDEVTYNNQTQYIPRNMNDTRIFFGMGLYENELPVTVTDGTLRIGIKLENGGSYHMVAFDDFRLYYLGQDNNITFADGNVKTICVANWDTDDDGELSEAEAAAVTSLGEVFKGNTEITSFNELQFFTDLTSIGNYAFQNCSSLTSITIPNSVTSIGSNAFYGTAWYNNQPDGLVYAGKVAYKYKGTMPNNTDIVLEEGTLGIADFAFYNCSGLTSITIGNSVTNIGSCAFLVCTGLTSITIPNSVTSIGSEAFGHCTGLTSITIGNSVTNIGSSAFYNCTGLTSITIPNSVTSIERDAFDGCSGLTSITIGSSVTSIGASAFASCSGLTSIHISDLAWWCNTNFFSSGLLNHVHHLYLGDQEITNLVIPEGVTNISSNTFWNCTYITSVTIPNSVTSIGNWAFYGCSSLTSITIPNSVTSIGSEAFNSCTGLTSVIVGAATPLSITSYTFSNRANATLYVPIGSKAAYQTADYWKEFGEIVELGELYSIDHTANRGAEFDLPILMNNGNEAITAFQFDVELPEGMTLVSAKLSDRKADQSNPVPTLQSDGSYRLATFSTTGSSFSGSEGTLLNLRIKVSTDAALGEQTVTLKNIELTTTSKAFELINQSSTITVLDVLTGDASGDGKVSIFDAVQIVNYILGNTPETFVELAADVDGNGKISIFDAVLTVNIILNQGSTNNARMTTVDSEVEPQ